MAEMLVASLTAEFDPYKYTDDYWVEGLDLIAKKAAGEELELPAATADEAPKIVDLMAALEASVAAAKQSRQRHPPRAPVAARTKRAPAKKAAAKRPTRRMTA
jgi:DNA end-binding protein Ku